MEWIIFLIKTPRNANAKSESSNPFYAYFNCFEELSRPDMYIYQIKYIVHI